MVELVPALHGEDLGSEWGWGPRKRKGRGRKQSSKNWMGLPGSGLLLSGLRGCEGNLRKSGGVGCCLWLLLWFSPIDESGVEAKLCDKEVSRNN